MKIIRGVFNYFLPEICPCCQKEFSEGNLFCLECLNRLPVPGEAVCRCCGGDLDLIIDLCSKCIREAPAPWSGAICLFMMDNNVLKIVEQYKYNNKIEFLTQFASLAADKIRDSKVDFDCITSIPLHFLKYLYRGFNQSALLSKNIAKHTGIGYKTLLVRRKFTKTQTKLSGDQRRRNLEGAFSPRNSSFIKDKNILLVDDVFTTGSTLRSASEALLSAGASRVTILVLARR